MEILNFTGLASQKDKLAKNLSSGNQKLLAISIAFATNPKLLLLDEPVTTLSPQMVKRVMELVAKVRRAGTTVIIIEHNMKAIMDYCDRIVVLAYGKKIAEGLPQEIRENKEVIEAYLGVMG
jgi:branched-chain amino acid transport system ATP-binding protein